LSGDEADGFLKLHTRSPISLIIVLIQWNRRPQNRWCHLSSVFKTEGVRPVLLNHANMLPVQELTLLTNVASAEARISSIAAGMCSVFQTALQPLRIISSSNMSRAMDLGNAMAPLTSLDLQDTIPGLMNARESLLSDSKIKAPTMVSKPIPQCSTTLCLRSNPSTLAKALLSLLWDQCRQEPPRLHGIPMVLNQ
jgi:hypothetical protein